MSSAWLLFRLLNLSSFSTHRLRTALSVLGVALGVSLVFAVLIFNSSLTGSFSLTTSDLRGGANLEVTSASSAGIDQAVVDRARTVPGVKLAAPILLQRAGVRGPRGSAQVLIAAYDKESEKLASALLESLGVSHLLNHPGVAASQSLLERTGAYPDRTLVLVADGRQTPLGIVSVLSRRSMGQLSGTYLVVTPLEVAQRLFGDRGLDSSVLIETADRSPAAVEAVAQRLRAALGTGVQVISPEDRVRELDRSTEQLRWYALLVSSLALLPGGYLVFNTMSMAVVERRKELATLLVLGDSPRGLLRRFMAETLLLGGAGVALGLPLGWLVGQYLVSGVPQYLLDAYGYYAQPLAPPWTAAAAAAAGLATAVLAALFPATFVLRTAPADALRRHPSDAAPRGGRVRAIGFLVGLALIALGIVGGRLFAEAGVVLNGLLFAGLALAAPTVFGVVIGAVARALAAYPLRTGSGTMQVTGANLLHSPRRTTATVTAAAFSLVMVIAMGELAGNAAASIATYAGTFAHFPLYVSASYDTYESVPLDASLQEAVTAVPGVAAAYAGRSTFISWHGRRRLLIGASQAAVGRQGLTFQAGTPAIAVPSLASDGMLISTQNAQRDRLHLGDLVRLDTPTGGRGFRVTGVVEDWAWPEGVMIIGADAFASDFRQPEINQLAVLLTPGSAPAAVSTRLRRLAPGLIVRSGAGYTAQVLRQLSAFFEPFLRLRDILVLVGVLAVLNTVLISVLQRLPELGVLRSVGMSAAQLTASFVLEAVAMVVVALAGAALFGLLFHGLSVASLHAITGLPLRWAPEPAPLVTAAAAGVVIVVGGSFYPARRAGRIPLLDAIAYE